MTSAPKRPFGTRTLPKLLYTTSFAWALAALASRYASSEVCPWIALATLVPPLLGVAISKYPWLKDANAPVSLFRKFLQGLLLLAGAVSLGYSTFYLLLFSLISFVTGME